MKLKVDVLFNEIYNKYQLLLKENTQSRCRLMVAIAGPPGSGKSTISSLLCSQLLEKNISTIVVPMDGYHLDNCILEKRNLKSRKGSPPTFDVIGFKVLLDRLSKQQQQQQQQHHHSNNNNSNEIIIPIFDRELDLAKAGADVVDSSTEILLIEGNYLLLKDSPWCELKQYFDLTIFIDADQNILEKRLIQRWLDHQHDNDSAIKRAMSNDIPNATLTKSNSSKADITYLNND